MTFSPVGHLRVLDTVLWRQMHTDAARRARQRLAKAKAEAKAKEEPGTAAAVQTASKSTQTGIGADAVYELIQQYWQMLDRRQLEIAQQKYQFIVNMQSASCLSGKRVPPGQSAAASSPSSFSSSPTQGLGHSQLMPDEGEGAQDVEEYVYEYAYEEYEVEFEYQKWLQNDEEDSKPDEECEPDIGCETPSMKEH